MRHKIRPVELAKSREWATPSAGIRVRVAVPPARDSYAVVGPSLEAWEDLGNGRDRRDSKQSLENGVFHN
jgi:hypothetical protein